jgi:hypothetical protein
MERGFLLDRKRNTARPGEWIEGEPERSFWSGLKLRGRKRLQVVAHRCPRCGRLDLSAPES